MIGETFEHHPEMSVRSLCELFGVNRSWYYSKPSPEERLMREVALRDAIERMVLEFPGYGYRRVTKALQREGWIVNHKRVLRIMREGSLLCQLKRRFVRTTDSQHSHNTYSNLIEDADLTGPDQG